MKVILLTQGKVALVSDADYWLVRPFKWAASRARDGRRWYAMANPVYGRSPFSMHRLLAGFPPFKLDHRNRNGLDNRRSNLRPATASQNQANSVAQSRNTSGFKGVSGHYGKWRAQIIVKGQKFSLGVYNLAEEAATAYGFAALSAFGEYAKLC